MRNSFFFIFILLFTIAACNPAATSYDNGKTLLFFSRADSLAVMQNLEKGDFYKYNSADSALRYYNIAFQITTYKTGLITADSIYSAKDEGVLQLLHAKSQLKMGLAFNVQAMYNNAVRSLTQCELILEELQKSRQGTIASIASKELSACYINLGLVHQFLESSDIAKEMIRRAIANKQATDDTLNMEGFYIEAANYYLNEAEEATPGTDLSYWLEMADSYLKPAEKTMHKQDRNRSLLRYHLAKARLLLLEKKFEPSEKHLLLAEELSINVGENYWRGQACFILSRFKLEMALRQNVVNQDLLRQSILYGEKGFGFAIRMGDVQLQKKLSRTLQKAYKLQANMPKYSEYVEKYVSIRDTIVDQLKRGTLAALEQEHLASLEKQRLEQLSQESEALNRELRNERIFTLFVLISLVILIVGLTVIFRSRNKQKKLLGKLSENEKHLQSLVLSIPGTFYRCLPDKDYTMVYLSEEVLKLTGYPKELFLSKNITFSEIIHPDDQAVVANQVSEAIELHKHYELEYRILRFDKEVVYVFAKGIAEYDANGKPVMLNGTILDITEHKKSEIELKAALDRIYKLTSSAPVSIITWDLDTTILEWNTQAEETFGWSREEAIGRSYLELNVVHQDDFNLAEIRQQVVDGRIQSHEQHENKTKDGRIITCEWNNSIIYNDDGQPVSVISMAHDISEKIAAEKQLKDIYILSDRALDLTKSGFWQIQLNDFQHFIASERAKNIFGFVESNSDEFPDLASVIRQIAKLNPDSASYISERLKNVFFGEEDHFEFEHEYLHPQTGDALWIKSKAYLDKDEKGNPMRLYGVSQDITLTKRLQKDLETAREAAEAATKAKSDFLANMSHEIRTPMNAIIGMTHLVQKTKLDDKQSDYIKKISRSANALLGIINDILDFSKIEAGKMNIENIEFELQEVLNGVTDLVMQKAHQKNLEFLIRIDQNVPAFLVGDPLRIGQIITNLCSNAVKFTEAGEIVVDVSAVSKTEKILDLKVEVKDTGIGLSPEQKQKLFKAFSQADTSTTRKYGGTGLGLTISQNLVSLMNGTIDVESEAGKGSNFSFTIECGLAEKQKEQDFTAPVDIMGLKVMVCDDNETAREILAEALRTFSFEVLQAASAFEAIQMLKTEKEKPVELLLMDYKMPEINGLQALSLIYKDPLVVLKPKVIMVSAYGRDEVSEHTDYPFFYGFVEKPLNYSLLFNTIMNVFGHKKLNYSRFEEPEDQLLSKLSAFKGSKILLVEDNEINQQVAKEIIEETGLLVEIASNGAEAVDLIQNSGNPSKYHLVLMDLQMPVMDGISATKEIRKLHDYVTLPILAMTADAMAGVKEKILEAGMMDMLTKPIDPSEVYRKILKWMVKAEGLSPLIQPGQNMVSHKQTVDLPVVETLNMTAALQRLNNNKELYLSILKMFLQNNQHFVAEAKALFQTQETDTLKRHFHTLKGLAGSIGAEDIQQLAAELEQTMKPENQHQFDKLILVLDNKLEHLFQMLRTKLVKKNAAIDPAGKDLMAKMISDLEELIKKKSPLAKKLVHEMEQSGVTGAPFQRLKNALNSFNFKEAAIQLAEIKANLNPA